LISLQLVDLARLDVHSSLQLGLHCPKHAVHHEDHVPLHIAALVCWDSEAPRNRGQEHVADVLRQARLSVIDDLKHGLEIRLRGAILL